jgi:hypothetical protein
MDGLTLRIIRVEQERRRGAVQLRPGIEDEFVRRQSRVRHRAGHVVSRTVDDEITEEGLALPEGAIERVSWI